MYELQRLEQFVRIWRRLGWSVEETDDALMVFGELPPPDSDLASNTPQGGLVITPSTIKSLATVRKISDLSTLNCLPLLLATVGMSHDDFVQIQDNEGLGDDLTPDTLWVYYRHITAASMAGVPYSVLLSLLMTLSTEVTPLSTPETWLKTVESWKTLQADGWDATSLFDVAGRLGSKNMQTLKQCPPALTETVIKYLSKLENRVSGLNAALMVESPKDGNDDKGKGEGQDQVQEKRRQFILQSSLLSQEELQDLFLVFSEDVTIQVETSITGDLLIPLDLRGSVATTLELLLKKATAPARGHSGLAVPYQGGRSLDPATGDEDCRCLGCCDEPAGLGDSLSDAEASMGTEHASLLVVLESPPGPG
ncbi:uncharacterized protein LY79DRAFT_585292 [Colletotrichum navitas]|uniref:HTH merR-type domain-containing protein n=1 Tax=Colletotrichum navitas TaxID=681940 RepID=A0AAD8PJ13_9PEZI|nr:uncharacterized protein LY79DRAFT_585292 [Colletotrichum navitas]KAK1564156.1 hypothetical protein LY79DRAFT_585292 [Colletotrichum navitas]